MSKFKILTIAEYSKFNLSKNLEELINQYNKGKSIENSELRILDWGCGRGRSVLKLKSMGYDAYGVEIDPKPIKNAGSLFQHYGFEADKHLFEIDESCKVSFPADYFNIVFSEQVLEHVKNIDLLFEEIARITKPGGITFHAFPYKYHFTEQHLYMPLIHWLPKNSIRKLAINFWLRLGKDPHWKDLTKKAIPRRRKGTTPTVLIKPIIDRIDLLIGS